MKLSLYLFILVIAILVGVNITASEYNHYYNSNYFSPQLNKFINLRGSIQRVVSLAPNITEIIFSLETQNKLVGVTQYSDYPIQAKLLPSVGSYIHLDLEKIVALKPDICFATKEGNPIEIINRLESLGIPVYLANSNNLNSLLSLVIDIGFLLEADAKASFLVNNLNKRISHIKTISSRAKESPLIFFQLSVSPIISAGKGTIINDLIETVRGINVVKESESYPRFTREDILKFAPDIIIITSTKNNDLLSREKSEWEDWPNLPATLSNNIFLEEASLFDRSTPRLIDGLELLAKKVHPKLFEDLL